MSRSRNDRPNQRNRDPDRERLVAAAKNLTNANGRVAGPNAVNVLKTAMNFSDPLNSLSVLLDDPNVGSTVLRKAFSVTASDEGFIPTLLSFFGFLGRDKFGAGTSKLSRDAIYRVAYGTAGLMLALTASLPLRSSDEKQILAWFLVAVCLSNSDARTNDNVVEMAKFLCNSEGAAIQAMRTLIFPHERSDDGAMDVSAASNLDSLQALDPKHDNDFPTDFRKIRIIPTADEINTTDSLPGSALVPRASPPDEAAILDRQFRLLREDMVAPIISELKELKAANRLHGSVKGDVGAAHLKRRLYPNPLLVDVGVDQFSSYVLLLVPIPPHLTLRLSALNTTKERIEFCTEGPGRRVLAHDSLLLFLNGDYSVGCTGRVVRRDKKEFLRHDGYFCVGVGFSDADLSDVFRSVRLDKCPGSVPLLEEEDGRMDTGEGGNSDGDNFAAFAYQTSYSVFAYEPILRSLQDVVSIPFKHELVQQRPPLPLLKRVPLCDRAAAAVADDPQQREAMLSALQQRVCLIQGPPGTGKTFVGVQIARALLDQQQHEGEMDVSGSEDADSSEPVRILCLCYTNHALDDFLLSLHEEGGVPLEEMLRLGRSPKIHEKLKGRALSENQDPFNRLQARRFAMTKTAMQGLEDEINSAKQQISRLGQSWSWTEASAFLSEESPYDVEMERIYTQFQQYSPEVDGVSTVGPADLWTRWVNGDRVSGVDPIWMMSPAEREALVDSWQERHAQAVYDRLAGDMRAYTSEVEELHLLREEAKLPAAARAKVLGCTTTSAAKNREILSQLRPTVVIVEEACEILEANLLTCLGPSVRHLIMIGDHKQLRPKLECHRLRKESGQGINFDVSLFERLAVSGFPMITLNEQRRMRPEICDLIRLTTYPELKDHQSVQDREPARGVSSNVIFIDHNHHENDDTENAVLNTSSKVNTHEAGMVREIVRYFLRQGYQPADIVVLTPYLGQLVLIREELKKIKINVNVSELDSQELRGPDGASGDAGDALVGLPPLRSLGVRVATVDNFQGEEAKIIIGSLVRCNERAEIGFVAGAERVNVLLSRARDALVLLGSADTLRNARRLRGGTADWPGIIDHARSILFWLPCGLFPAQAVPKRAN